MKSLIISFGSFFIVISLLGQETLPPTPDLSQYKFKPLAYQELEKPALHQNKTTVEFSHAAPTRAHQWNADYLQKQIRLEERLKKDKELTRFLRNQDPTQKTEYFRKVLGSPVPDSFRGEPKYNPRNNNITVFSD